MRRFITTGVMFPLSVPCTGIVYGAGDPSMAFRLKDIPIGAFHGDEDPIVPFSGSKEMVGWLFAQKGAVKEKQ